MKGDWTRRQWVAAMAAGNAVQGQAAERIDRQALVRRHNPVLTDFSASSPLSVGNGEFAFTADVTGLQSFPDLYTKAMPLCTQSQWGWHSFPRVPGEFHLTNFDTYGRPVGYPTDSRSQPELYRWLRENPHRLHLGQLGFVLDRSEVKPIRQELDLWSGVLKSEFTFRGAAVTVETCVHPAMDALAVRVRPEQQPLPVRLAFPYGSPRITAADWNAADRHQTSVTGGEFRRTLDQDHYSVSLRREGRGEFTREGPHTFTWNNAAFVVRFSSNPGQPAPTVAATFAASAEHWASFWSNGGAVELISIPDSRARELERRIVLSQYQTAIQCAGSLPPQESGLTCNTWFGKFHLEMHWWHAAHFALWGRAPLLERSLGWYAQILPLARATAKRQGYRGVRWPKMVGPDGHDSPSPIGPLLVWQQPHPIAMAELIYQSRPARATLDRYADIVFETAEFLASFPVWDGKRYVIGPPVIPAQENHPPRETWNPTFELEYFAQALGIAQEWRKRLRRAPDPAWDKVRTHLSDLPVRQGVYLAHENCPQTFTERNRDHPSMLAALGVLRDSKVDRETMRRTLHKVLDEWRWADTWGWDYPMVAMTAARLGEPDVAVRGLMLDTPKNRWLPNGHTYQRPDLPLYLPSNGGLLTAIALMTNTPGALPRDWTVRREGVQNYL